ncbi:MAG TPA: tetratricopeptide repeat protein, partial [Candidatus Synoicihabitans sp.]|nr:tetratricopeptide repeat protein [Candidatus Synoicihabitans sp.]
MPSFPPRFTALLLTILTGIVYAHTGSAPFIFDDVPSIIDNATIRQLWPLTTPLRPPSEWGVTVSGRPILNLSLALNYAWSGLEVWSYHLVNTVIHLLAGLVLYGLLRRTLRREILPARLAEQRETVAALVAALWLLHPLQTESVTYVIQRAESLMGLFFMLSLYTFARALEAGRARRAWFVGSYLSALLAAGTKEVAAVIPVIALCYDRTFVAGSFAAAWRARRGTYLALASIWLPLGWLVATTGGNRGGTMGFDVDVAAFDYWITQFEAVTRYIWLTFWPHPLVFDYGKIPSLGWPEVLPWSIIPVALVTATLVALRRRPIWGFLGAWFFAIHAPTLIVPGELQMIVEHRMYLPLAAPLTAVVAVLALRAPPWTFRLIGAAAVLALGGLTLQRNTVYADEAWLWRDNIAKRPLNARAHNNLGRHYSFLGRHAEAAELHREAARLDPSLAQPHFNLGLALMRQGRNAEAIPCFEEAIRILPYYLQAHLHLGIARQNLEQWEEALAPLARAIELDPWPVDANFHRAVVMEKLHRFEEAMHHYAEVVGLNPKHIAGWSNWGGVLASRGAWPEAIERYETALRLRPDDAALHYNIGLAYAATGNWVA